MYHNILLIPGKEGGRVRKDLLHEQEEGLKNQKEIVFSNIQEAPRVLQAMTKVAMNPITM